MRNIICFILFLFLSKEGLAHKAESGKVLVTAGGFAYKTLVFHDYGEFQSPTLGGVAVIAEADFDERGGLEISLFYLSNKLYFREALNSYLIERIPRMYIITGYRYWFNSRVSAALGFYSSYSMGERQNLASTMQLGQDNRTTAKDLVEYGFDFSVQQELIYGERWGVVIDGRYSLPISNKNEEQSSHFGVLLGIKHQLAL